MTLNRFALFALVAGQAASSTACLNFTDGGPTVHYDEVTQLDNLRNESRSFSARVHSYSESSTSELAGKFVVGFRFLYEYPSFTSERPLVHEMSCPVPTQELEVTINGINAEPIHTGGAKMTENDNNIPVCGDWVFAVDTLDDDIVDIVFSDESSSINIQAVWNPQVLSKTFFRCLDKPAEDAESQWCETGEPVGDHAMWTPGETVVVEFETDAVDVGVRPSPELPGAPKLRTKTEGGIIRMQFELSEDLPVPSVQTFAFRSNVEVELACDVPFGCTTDAIWGGPMQRLVEDELSLNIGYHLDVNDDLEVATDDFE